MLEKLFGRGSCCVAWKKKLLRIQKRTQNSRVRTEPEVPMDAAEKEEQKDELAESINDLFGSVSAMVKSELQGSTNHLDLLEKMNQRVAEEYKGFGDVAAGLSVFVEQLKAKSGSFEEYVKQIDVIEQQVTEFEAVISVLDRYVSMLESKVQSVHQNPPAS